MARKRITQIFPFLLPLRVKQRKLFFYLKMRFDRNRYSKIIQNERLPYEVFHASFSMINEESGHDIQYQYNKVPEAGRRNNERPAYQAVGNVLVLDARALCG